MARPGRDSGFLQEGEPRSMKTMPAPTPLLFFCFCCGWKILKSVCLCASSVCVLSSHALCPVTAFEVGGHMAFV